MIYCHGPHFATRSMRAIKTVYFKQQCAVNDFSSISMVYKHVNLHVYIVIMVQCTNDSLCGCVYVAVFPAEQPVVADSSSSEDEGGEQVTPVVRRRRVKKSTTSSVPEPGEEVQESGHSDLEETLEEEQKEVQEEVQEEEVQQEPHIAPPPQGHVSGTLNKCILLALIIAISMGFGHFYGMHHGKVLGNM